MSDWRLGAPPGPPPTAGPEPAGGGSYGDSPPPRAEDRAAELRFAALLGALGALVLAAAAVLIALPGILEGPPLVYLIAYGTATLFGPVGFTLLAAAWRMRNRALHGAALPRAQRRALAILGAVLVGLGLLLVFSGFGVSGVISRTLNVVWGIALGMYGARFLLRAILSDRE